MRTVKSLTARTTPARKPVFRRGVVADQNAVIPHHGRDMDGSVVSRQLSVDESSALSALVVSWQGTGIDRHAERRRRADARDDGMFWITRRGDGASRQSRTTSDQGVIVFQQL
jgi:hypothetical protein